MRLIDADRGRETATIDLIVHHIDRQPAVDAVEVVRCGDCKYWTQDGNGYMEDEFHCGNPYGIEGYPEQDDFCSRGERRCE